MSDMITAEAAGKLLDGTTPGPWRYRPHKHDDWGVVRGGVFNEDWGGYPHLAQVRDPDKLDDPILNAHRASGKDPWEANARLTAAAPDLARTVIALHAQLADAKAAQAMVVERAARDARDVFSDHKDAKDAIDYVEQLIYAAPADTDGLALVQALREERDALETAREMLGGFWAEAAADRDRLAAANATLEAQVARLVEGQDVVSWLDNGEKTFFCWNTGGGDSEGEFARIGLRRETPDGRTLYREYRAYTGWEPAAVQADARREGGE